MNSADQYNAELEYSRGGRRSGSGPFRSRCLPGGGHNSGTWLDFDSTWKSIEMSPSTKIGNRQRTGDIHRVDRTALPAQPRAHLPQRYRSTCIA